MKKIIFSIMTMVLFLSINSVQAQKFFTKKAHIEFISKAPLENIEAKNNTATCVINTKTGAVQFAVLIKSFKFEKALMQEHFNENYMESGKFPKAIFKGEITNLDKVNFKKDGVYNATVKGKMQIHGVTKEIKTEGKVIIQDGKPTLKSTFKILVADYDIKTPKAVRNNIAEKVTIKVEATLKALKKKK